MEFAMSRTLEEHLFGPGPKRILALDGGGIRGILTIQILARIEKMLRERNGDPDARLSDYFDLIGGTSTGAIIAAGLALGWPTERVDALYRELGNSIFESSYLRWGLLRAKFSSKPLQEALKREFGDLTLGSRELKTGLAIVAKRLDTGSPWVVHNNPKGKYYEPRAGGTSTANKDFLLRKIVRASTAAPHYFEPEEIEISRDTRGAFVDGGISPHNNPALQLLMLATLGGHELNWRWGADRLMLVSVGTGSVELKLQPQDVMKMKALELAARSLASLMNDASNLNETLLQWFSRCPTSREIDREMGNLDADLLGGGKPLLTYLRYDAWLERDWLRDRLGMELSEEELESLAEMDKPENMARLIEIGRETGVRLVRPEHFPDPS